MNFNVTRPMHEGQLAALYNNPHKTPEQVDSDLRMGNSQGYGWVQDQASAMGIPNPAQYYAQKQLAAKMAATPSGFDTEVARLQGHFDPNSLAGQLQRRERTANALIEGRTIEARQMQADLASQRMSQYRLPAAGEAPTLSPVMQQDMRDMGIHSPMEYLMTKRLGGMATPSFANGEALPKPVVPLTGRVEPTPAGRLYNLPSFQGMVGRNPLQAATVFEGLSGQELGGYAKARGEAEKGARHAGAGSLRNALERGDAMIDEKTGKILWRSRVPSVSTGKMEATGPYGKGDLYQQSLEQFSGELGSELEQLRQLAIARGDGGAAEAAAALNMGAPTPNEIPDYMQATSSSSGGIGNFMQGMGGMIGEGFYDLLQGQAGSKSIDQIFRENASRPAGRAAIHARPLLANSEWFQNIARTNPERARRIIQSVQRGEQFAPAPTRYGPAGHPYMQ